MTKYDVRRGRRRDSSRLYGKNGFNMKKITLLFSISLLVSSLKAQVKNLGNFKINANSYVVATTAVVNTGATAVLTNDGTLRSTTAVTNNNTAIYKGSGTVTDALFTNNATVYVGNPLACLTFANAYTQTSVLQMDIGGTTACTQFDKINVTGTATLGGTLTVSSINGYSGTANDRLTLIQATALSGTFATVSLPTNWFINYNMPATGQVTLSYNTVLPVALAAIIRAQYSG